MTDYAASVLRLPEIGRKKAMADEPKKETVTLQELVVSNFAMTDALAKLMIARGVITDEEFKLNLALSGQTI